MICAFVILQRRHNIHWMFPVLGLALYTLASADIAYTMWLVFGNSDLIISYTYVRPHHWLFITNRYVLLQAYTIVEMTYSFSKFACRYSVALSMLHCLEP